MNSVQSISVRRLIHTKCWPETIWTKSWILTFCFLEFFQRLFIVSSTNQITGCVVRELVRVLAQPERLLQRHRYLHSASASPSDKGSFTPSVLLVAWCDHWNAAMLPSVCDILITVPDAQFNKKVFIRRSTARFPKWTSLNRPGGGKYRNRDQP